MTNTAARQGSDKSPEKEYGETRVTACVNHRRREAQSHSLALTLEQERVRRAPYDTRDTYGWRIYKQYGHYNTQTGYA